MKLTYLGTSGAQGLPALFCDCPACRSFSRAYIRHLMKAGEMLGMRLCVLHNLRFYNRLMEEIRDAIENVRAQRQSPPEDEP